MSGVCISAIVGIKTGAVKAHIPTSAHDNAEMPRPPRVSDSDSRRGLTSTDLTVIGNVERLYRQHGTIAGNQSQLARDAGLDQTFISKLLKARTSISVTSLHEIARALGLPPWALLVPGDWPLDNPPVLQPLSNAEKQLYAKIREAVTIAKGSP
jgi:transcriptional regulator with XRE-family HTH domain